VTGPTALVRTPWHGPWRCFARPDAIFEAYRVADVRPCLSAAEAAVRRTNGFAVGLVTYEAAAAFGLPTRDAADGSLPLAWFALFQSDQVSSLGAIPTRGSHEAGPWRASISADDYEASIDRIRAHIECGDTYQLNYTWRLSSPFDGDPLSLLAELDAAQRGQWSAYLDLGRHAICSASPELFFLRTGSRIECRPMKGTIRRGLSSAGDRKQAAALHASEKNRAENVMVVDMTRNDLGRIARIGSVTVPSLYDVERYPGHWQMTSTVAAEIDPLPLDEIFAALFPSGSVTGAPQHRSVALLRDLESGPRGAYTGAIGYLTPDAAHFNVAIRTVDVDREAGRAHFGVGSGVVWDSRARDEYEECLVKASILTRREPPFDLLESMAWTPADGFQLLDAHVARMTASAEYFGFDPIDGDSLPDAVSECVRGWEAPQKVRVLRARDGRLRCEAVPLETRSDPITLALASAPVRRDDQFLYHKTTRREVYESARRSRPDADAVLLWNEDGEVTEATEANVVVDFDGRLVTPPVECGLLPGVLRADLLAKGTIVEAPVTREALAGAHAVWLINSVRGWMRAVLIAES
jgi:para-aminobenzoate synthetase/4-amino-4-deoxychorismate lyase